ncbi:sulfite exporter TauE/SafE family protein [Janibacter anophelis]|uniref:sulfite exporter TauE/SafE family protein n=1 Tax=Janibacter anophelis TaxID=319054 RepID=UPI000832D2FE|nr:sulfite exporter TauE/SafE family protein [Janibacter anophelis]
MSWLEMGAVVLAGVWAGGINTLVGSGTLVTFPVLLALGVPAVTANVSNSIGLVPGGVSGSLGYLPEMKGMGRRVVQLVPMSVLGAITGALLLLWLPPEAFEAIVPVLIGIGILLVIFGPRLQTWAKRHHEDGGSAPTWHLVALMAGVLVAGVYGGYFGAAQGVILIGLLSALATEPLQALNGLKNVLGLVVNVIGSLVFIITAPELVDWGIAALIGIGSVVGGVLGARYGRRLPPNVLRGVIVVVGLAGLTKFVFFP